MTSRMATTTKKQNILNKVIGSQKLINKGTYLDPPITWHNNITQLNANNLNILSRGIKKVQDEFNIASNGLEEILSDMIVNNAGWKSAEIASGEIFNDYEKNRALGEYSSARGLNTTAGKVHLSSDGTQTIKGKASSTEGEGTVAASDHQHVIGKWNLLDEIKDADGYTTPGNNYAFIVGNGESEHDRSNAFTIDWHGSGEFSKNLTVNNNLTVGMNGNDRHLFKGKTRFENAVKIDSNLGVYGDVKLGGPDKNVTVNSNTTFKEESLFEGTATFKSHLFHSGNAYIGYKGTPEDLSPDNRANVRINGLLTIPFEDESFDYKLTNNDPSICIAAGGTVVSTSDFKIYKESKPIASLSEVSNCVDLKNLDINPDDTKTVPNAIAKVKSDLIGKTSLNTDNLGDIDTPTLSNDTIYGAAQFSINLVKSLLNAYILDGDSDDPETRTAIDKLIEIADWIKDDAAGAGKVISDLDDLSKNKLDASTYNTFKSTYDTKADDWDNAIHEHHLEDGTSNLSVLNSITSEHINKWNSITESSHSHENKETLDSITADNINSWNNAAEGLASLSPDAIEGILNGSEQIEENTEKLNEVNATIGNTETEGTVLYRLSALETSVNTSLEKRLADLEDALELLISAGTTEPDDNVPTNYYVKY